MASPTSSCGTVGRTQWQGKEDPVSAVALKAVPIEAIVPAGTLLLKHAPYNVFKQIRFSSTAFAMHAAKQTR
jgi:hypothetical protein